MRRLLTIPLLVLVSSLLMPSSARGECLAPGVRFLRDPRSELVFSGDVVNVVRLEDFGVRVTFIVDRVWKGTVTKSIDLYVWELDAEMPSFKVGKRYIVSAETMTEPSRRRFGLTNGDAPSFKPTFCGTMDYTPEDSRKFGNWRSPT